MRRNNRNNRRFKKTKKSIPYIYVFFIVVVVILMFFIVFQKNDNDNYNDSQLSKNVEIDDFANGQIDAEESKKPDTTFTMTAIGDVMCHNTQYWDAYIKEKDEYDFSYVFDDISSYIENNDISIGSLETSFAGKERGYSNYPTFNSPDNLAYSLKNIGLDVLSTAGNHCLDMGFSGLSRTIDILDDAGISHLGTYKTSEDRNQILFEDVKGLKVAFINYTYGTNGIPIPSGKDFCVNLIDKTLMKKDIENAKSQDADVIVACMHWGTEYKTTANDEQKDLADFLFENGVDIILGNHPHVLEPMEKRTVTLSDGTVKDGFVIYALGNFICDQNAENTRNSIILNLTITKHSDGKVSIDKADYVPIYMYKTNSLKLRKMKLLDIEKTISYYEKGINTSIGQETYNNLKIQLDKIKAIVGSEF